MCSSSQLESAAWQHARTDLRATDVPAARREKESLNLSRGETRLSFSFLILFLLTRSSSWNTRQLEKKKKNLIWGHVKNLETWNEITTLVVDTYSCVHTAGKAICISSWQIYWAGFVLFDPPVHHHYHPQCLLCWAINRRARKQQLRKQTGEIILKIKEVHGGIEEENKVNSRRCVVAGVALSNPLTGGYM